MAHVWMVYLFKMAILAMLVITRGYIFSWPLGFVVSTWLVSDPLPDFFGYLSYAYEAFPNNQDTPKSYKAITGES